MSGTNQIISEINSLGTVIVKTLDEKLPNVSLGSYRTSWEKLEDKAKEIVTELLMKKFSSKKISSPKSKSTYPDIKLEINDECFAIDIKTAELQKDPWFDMARLDTIKEARLDAYKEEWEVIIKYDSQQQCFKKSYFNLFREVVGKRNECDGVKYRPYDGKVRPKSWDDFEKGVVYWKTHKDFINGIEKSLKHRWKTNIEKHLVPKLSPAEKVQFKKLFD